MEEMKSKKIEVHSSDIKSVFTKVRLIARVMLEFRKTAAVRKRESE